VSLRPLVCSNCFRDAGLRYEAERIGRSLSKACPNCGSPSGTKLTKGDLFRLRDRFFRHATAPHGVGGYHVPVLEINSTGDVDDDVDMSKNTWTDWLLIKSKLGGRLFYNAPALWKIGITEHYDSNAEVTEETIADVVGQLAITTLTSDSAFFRIRKNLRGPSIYDSLQYDAPPAGEARPCWRFDDASNPILYASPSLSVCIHECRILLTDRIVAATLVPNRDLRLAELSGNYIQTPRSPFEDLTHFFNGLVFSAETYDVCRRLAKAVQKSLNVEGIIYKSFFTTVIDGPAINYAIFGHPIEDGRLAVTSINQVRLDEIRYQYCLGPALDLTTE
jgi:hypothetical protein